MVILSNLSKCFLQKCVVCIHASARAFTTSQHFIFWESSYSHPSKNYQLSIWHYTVIQGDLQSIQCKLLISLCIPWESNLWPWLYYCHPQMAKQKITQSIILLLLHWSFDFRDQLQQSCHIASHMPSLVPKSFFYPCSVPLKFGFCYLRGGEEELEGEGNSRVRF